MNINPVSRKTCKGKLDYNSQNVTILLDILQDVLSLGSHLWAVVEKESNLRQKQTSQTQSIPRFTERENFRDYSTQRIVPTIRTAHRTCISKKILPEYSTLSVGEEKDVDIELIDNDEDLEVNLGHRQENLFSASFRKRIRNQLDSAKSVEKERYPLFSCIEDVAESIFKMSNSFSAQNSEIDIQK